MKAILSIISILFLSVLLIGPLTLFGCKKSNEKLATFGNATSAKSATFENVTSKIIKTEGQKQIEKITKRKEK